VNNRSKHHVRAVVIGGSAGVLVPLRRLVADIPANFPAAVFVANHVPSASASALPHILSRSGALFATYAVDGDPIEPGRIIVAPPGHHLTLDDGRMHVSQGPLKNNHRPSIDMLFRSAASTFDDDVCGVLLSGMLDDGVAGMVAIHDAGGATFAQDPQEAQFPDMPRSAIATGAIDGIYSAARLYGAISRWLEPQKPAPGMVDLLRAQGEGQTRHLYSDASLLAARKPNLEAALWESVRALEERRDLLRRLATRARKNGVSTSSQQFERRSAEVEANLNRLRALLASFTTVSSLA
jgi:two-component system chemotaxis response regulator CheB